MKESEIIRLYDMYSDSIYKLAYSYVGSAQDAEDVVQSIFLKLIQKDIHISKGKEKSYLLTMAVNACKDILKSAGQRLAVPFEEVISASDETGVNIFSEEESGLFEALKKLPEDYRVTIHLHYFEGYKVKEIAKIMKISTSAVTMRLTRGRNMLAELMENNS